MLRLGSRRRAAITLTIDDVGDLVGIVAAAIDPDELYGPNPTQLLRARALVARCRAAIADNEVTHVRVVR